MLSYCNMSAAALTMVQIFLGVKHQVIGGSKFLDLLHQHPRRLCQLLSQLPKLPVLSCHQILPDCAHNEGISLVNILLYVLVQGRRLFLILQLLVPVSGCLEKVSDNMHGLRTCWLIERAA